MRLLRITVPCKHSSGNFIAMCLENFHYAALVHRFKPSIIEFTYVPKDIPISLIFLNVPGLSASNLMKI